MIGFNIKNLRKEINYFCHLTSIVIIKLTDSEDSNFVCRTKTSTKKIIDPLLFIINLIN